MNKRTKQETIDLLKDYAEAYKRDAEREKDLKKCAYYLGKAEAYELAVFEIEKNME